ncbi:SPOR domain-containing protein [Roseateles sp. DAIF2]|uniref:SPOR domain-containing protein n=1 Tax=Roseateles sp. DAIF2 TaxID=2714952 RepID=UPI0018A31EC3|nr:SPOR domain-containing protein [Roseateles sp. DAIF2]QPF73791.1 SPOR domain-containing protein [Roseateles sp. DAIF2]
MGLLSSLFKRNVAPAARPEPAGGDVQQLRLRARRRLIGVALLVGLGVIGFPLVFETQPRPIPVDLPIDIPRKETATPLSIPPAATLPVAKPPLPQEPPVEVAAAPVENVVAPAPRPEPKPELKPELKPEPRVEPKHESKPEPEPKSKAEPKREPPAAAKPSADEGKAAAGKEAARVQALLEGKKPEASAAAAGAGRFIVQVGAYADNKAAHEARMKVERLGLKTYTQAVETADGKRIRVRVGPFASREEADKVAAKVRGGGLSTAVLTL